MRSRKAQTVSIIQRKERDSDQKPDDLDLVERLARGDEQAFAELVARYHDKVFHLARGIVGDWHRSEDVCQEVFTIVYRKIGGFRRSSLFSTWLYRVTVRAALKTRRRWKRREEVSLEFGGSLPAPAPAASLSFESEEVVVRLLKPLPEKLRVPVLLREAGGLSYDEIAQVLECSRGAVEQRLHRAMKLLREVWKDLSENHE